MLCCICVSKCWLNFTPSYGVTAAGAWHSLPPCVVCLVTQGTTPLVICWAGTVPDRHSPKLVLLYAGLLYYYSYGHIIQAVCMRAVQWLYNGCIYVCCVVGRPDYSNESKFRPLHSVHPFPSPTTHHTTLSYCVGITSCH